MYDDYGQPVYNGNGNGNGDSNGNNNNSNNGYYDQGDSYSQDYYNTNQPPMMPDNMENFSDFSSYGPQPGTPGGQYGAGFPGGVPGAGSSAPGMNGYAPAGSGYNNAQYTPSQFSYGEDMNGFQSTSGASTPPMYDPNAIAMALPNDPYPAWTADSQAPATIEQIEDIFIDLTNKFGFQRDSMRNMFDHFMTLLDSRSSRMSPDQALLSLHADYIGGDTANYKKWYFAAQLDMDDAVGFRNMNIGKLSRKARKLKKKKKKEMQEAMENGENTEETLEKIEGDNSLEAADFRWKAKMNVLTPAERIQQIALYLLIWGEANQVRFTPECLCFIYKCALDYLESPQCQQRVEPMPEGDYLNRVITPLYRFIRDQVYEIVDGRFVKREKDHAQIIGYDDVNQLFWYPEGIAKIVLEDETKLIDLPVEERYLRLGDVVWDDVFFKTYKETRF